MSKEQGGPRGFKMSESEVPQMTFTTLVLSLSTSAMLHLGVMPPAEGDGSESAERPEPNLPLARQSIDILEMLKEKTRGNLIDDEAKVLEQILHQLHLAYVEVRGG